MATSASEQLTMVEDCEKRESKLTEWEVGFMDSVRNQLEKEHGLTDKQADTLERIWDRVTS